MYYDLSNLLYRFYHIKGFQQNGIYIEYHNVSKQRPFKTLTCVILTDILSLIKKVNMYNSNCQCDAL